MDVIIPKGWFRSIERKLINNENQLFYINLWTVSLEKWFNSDWIDELLAKTFEHQQKKHVRLVENPVPFYKADCLDLPLFSAKVKTKDPLEWKYEAADFLLQHLPQSWKVLRCSQDMLWNLFSSCKMVCLGNESVVQDVKKFRLTWDNLERRFLSTKCSTVKKDTEKARIMSAQAVRRSFCGKKNVVVWRGKWCRGHWKCAPSRGWWVTKFTLKGKKITPKAEYLGFEAIWENFTAFKNGGIEFTNETMTFEANA